MIAGFGPRLTHPSSPSSAFTIPYAVLSMMTRELTPNDYELLSNLDSLRNSERKGGLSETEISVLPTNVVAGNNTKVLNCCICLEDQVTGQLVRRLPCMHAFHCECIDRWLQEKSSCPICMKSARPTVQS